MDEPEQAGGSCEHILVDFERTVEGGMATILGKRCLICGQVSDTMKAPN